jgi:ferritin-like protein
MEEEIKSLELIESWNEKVIKMKEIKNKINNEIKVMEMIANRIQNQEIDIPTDIKKKKKYMDLDLLVENFNNVTDIEDKIKYYEMICISIKLTERELFDEK